MFRAPASALGSVVVLTITRGLVITTIIIVTCLRHASRLRSSRHLRLARLLLSCWSHSRRSRSCCSGRW
ncbi:hypothetical protein PF001_g32759 [Phytophthora fragariae]|uniref:Uncharacterized protein n=1 Tax=Phytophthora fragariae TaxID=53985 RepID=A0A6A4ARP4_9STRA|nr:hypothetical protein PF001_g32759 [Phytophthora fragariae]